MEREPVEHVQASVFDQKYPFASNVLDLESYFKEYAQLIQSTLTVNPEEFNPRKKTPREVLESEHEFYKLQLGISDEDLKELMDVTNPDNLTCDGELEPFSMDEANFKLKDKSTVPENNLAVFKKTEKKNVPFTLKQFGYKFVPDYSTKNWNYNLNSLNFDQIVYCVKVYHPFSSAKHIFARVKLLQEIHLLGNQYLYDLKDKIECNMDYMGFKDVSDDCFLKEVGLKMTAKERYPSSFIFIEDTFYNDSRKDPSGDNCKTIKDWIESRELGRFNISSMREKPLVKIRLKIGHPYVYQHQGSCEHVIVFSDVRLLNVSDPEKSRCYPKVHAIGNTYVKKCMMCDGYAKWLVINNKRLTHDRCFLCNKCYKSYNYKNGVKIGDFKAYEFVDPVAIL